MMDQSSSNAPIFEPKPGPAGWISVWVKAISRPGEQTFIEITESPDATSKTAFIWVFIASTLSALVSGLLGALLAVAGFERQMPGLGQFMRGGAPRAVAGTGFIGAICGAPVAGLVSVLFFAIGVAIVQWVAKLFKGAGTFDKLAYAYASITVPITLISMFLTPLGAIPYVGICTGLLSVGIGLYALFLQIAATKAVNRFGWGAAAGSVFLPLFVVFMICFCVAVALGMVLGPAIGNVFRQINQGLAP